MSRPFTLLALRLKTHCSPEPYSGCWLWEGAIASSGYGKVGSGGNRGKTLSAHKASWIAFRGAIPDRLQVLHICDNKLCVNPNHLFLGTQKDNLHDAMRKGRRKTKTTDAMVAEMHKQKQSGMSGAAIARLLGLHPSHVQGILSGKRKPGHLRC